MESQIYIHETVGIRFREAASINEVDMAQTSLWRRKRKKKRIRDATSKVRLEQKVMDGEQYLTRQNASWSNEERFVRGNEWWVLWQEGFLLGRLLQMACSREEHGKKMQHS
jgi:hypothetical protein